MCFDHSTGKLYWAQFATVHNHDMCLYVIDTNTVEIENLGNITPLGAEILGMFIPYEREIEPTPPPTTEPPTTEPPTTEPPTTEPPTTTPPTQEPPTEEPPTQTPPTDIPPTQYAQGDVNMDGKVDTGDASMILRYSVGLVDLAPDELLLADYNADGKIDTGDAAGVLRFTVGL